MGLTPICGGLSRDLFESCAVSPPLFPVVRDWCRYSHGRFCREVGECFLSHVTHCSHSIDLACLHSLL